MSFIIYWVTYKLLTENFMLIIRKKANYKKHEADLKSWATKMRSIWAEN